MLITKMKNILNGSKQKNELKANTKRSTAEGSHAIREKSLWSKAGILQFRLGSIVYDCRTYPFDRAIQKSVNADPNGKRAGWAKHVKGIYAWTNNPCHHVLAGRVTARKVCTKNYECYHCAYDQMLDQETREGIIAFHTIYDGRHVGTRLRTTMLYDYGQPHWTTPDENRAILERVFDASYWAY